MRSPAGPQGRRRPRRRREQSAGAPDAGAGRGCAHRQANRSRAGDGRRPGRCADPDPACRAEQGRISAARGDRRRDLQQSRSQRAQRGGRLLRAAGRSAANDGRRRQRARRRSGPRREPFHGDLRNLPPHRSRAGRGRGRSGSDRHRQEVRPPRPDRGDRQSQCGDRLRLRRRAVRDETRRTVDRISPVCGCHGVGSRRLRTGANDRGRRSPRADSVEVEPDAGPALARHHRAGRGRHRRVPDEGR